MFWSPQQMTHAPDVANWTEVERKRLASAYFFLLIGVSIPGNFFGGWLAKLIGYRPAIALMFVGFFASMFGTYIVPRDHVSLLFWTPWVGFFSGVFGLFTMYVPALFPTLLRTTGAGFSYNIGRLAAAAGTVIFGMVAHVGNFRVALLFSSLLFLPAMAVTFLLPNLRDR
jgi:MFS family permease